MKQTVCNFYSFLLVLGVIVHSNNRHTILSTEFSESTGDTTSFSPNQGLGWILYSSYLNQDTPDSIQFEFLIKHDNGITWNDEQNIGGIINNNFKPASSQNITYRLLSNSIWNIRIEPNGQCYLKLIEGIAPADDPVILPVSVRYKSN